MSRLLCCLRDMGAALSHGQEDACDGAGQPAAPPTMADVIRERKKKAGGAALGTLRRRLAAAARRPRDARPDRGCEHARMIRSVVWSWRLAEVFLLCEQLEAGAALRDLVTQAELAREPAPGLAAALSRARRDRWWCDVELCGGAWVERAHRCILAARSEYFRRLLQRYPPPVYRVPLEGACAGITRAELRAALRVIYAGGAQLEQAENTDGDLDIINMDQSNSLCRGSCRGVGVGVGPLLGCSTDCLSRDMRYLLDSGEMSDCRLSWGGYELPAHRVVLAARSRYFRSVMSRRGGGGAGGGAVGVVSVDEQVLPPRFGRALLHAAYTDQVDLSLISRGSSSPAAGSSASAWAGGRARATSQASLDDAFQLYEIARFLEMPIAVQGCEDAIVEALSADSLPAVLRWAAAPHASAWVHRQAMRYFRDEFPSVMASPACGQIARTALAAALGSPFLQASEPAALRALLRWAERTEPNVVWHTAHSVSRRCRRGVSDAALRAALGTLVSLVRTEHLPPAHELLQQLVRRGVVPPPPSTSSADAWLGRSTRPARCFLPYLDELKALLQSQAPPEAELARMRRARLAQRIPDTLYMVTAPPPGAAASGAGACVSPRLLHALRTRARELRATAACARALKLHAHDARTVLTQIALRAVREMSLPDACAELLLSDDHDDHDDREREWESPSERRRWEDSTPPDCCRRLSGGRCSSAASLRADHDNSRSSTCRREPPSRSSDSQHSRQSVVSGAGSPAPPSAAPPSGGRLSLCVPDVAMAPNANTHLLAAPYCRQPEYSGGGVLQLDLGDGATHTPRPGSRAARALAAGRERRHDELRAALDVGARGYSFQPRAPSPGPGGGSMGPVGSMGPTVPMGPNIPMGPSGSMGPDRSLLGSGGSLGPGGGTLGPNTGSLGPGVSQARCRTLPHCRDLPPALHHTAASRSRAMGASQHGPMLGVGVGSPSHSPSPRRQRARIHHSYRLEPSYGSSGSNSRGPSPNNYA